MGSALASGLAQPASPSCPWSELTQDDICASISAGRRKIEYAMKAMNGRHTSRSVPYYSDDPSDLGLA